MAATALISVRFRNSATVPRTRTTSPGLTSTPKPSSKTKMPSEVAGFASASASSSWTKKPRDCVVAWRSPTTTASIVTSDPIIWLARPLPCTSWMNVAGSPQTSAFATGEPANATSAATNPTPRRTLISVNNRITVPRKGNPVGCMRQIGSPRPRPKRRARESGWPGWEYWGSSFRGQPAIPRAIAGCERWCDPRGPDGLGAGATDGGPPRIGVAPAALRARSGRRGPAFDGPGLRGYGRGERIRTSGLYVPNVALYQAKLHPDCRCRQISVARPRDGKTSNPRVCGVVPDRPDRPPEPSRPGCDGRSFRTSAGPQRTLILADFSGTAYPPGR